MLDGIQVDQWGTNQQDEVLSVAIGTEGEAIVAGRTSDALDGQSFAGEEDLFVGARFGNVARNWTRQWGSSLVDNATRAATDRDGVVYVAGMGWNPSGGAQASIDAMHTQDWTTHWGSAGRDEVTDLARDSAGNFFVSGWTAGNLAATNAGLESPDDHDGASDSYYWQDLLGRSKRQSGQPAPHPRRQWIRRLC